MSVVPSRSRPLPTEEPEVDFATLGLIEPLVRAVRNAGYQRATPIQASAIPHALDGRDVLGAAQTGTGKTAAFSLPLLQHLSQQERARGARRPVRALVLSPTRELASQIEDCIAKYGASVDIRHTVIFGGVSANNQVRELERGVDVLVATPGRLWDLLQQKLLDLGQVEILVLDEVDRMLDQGFWPTVRKIVAKVPKKRQTLAFSATMPDALKPLIAELLVDPVRVSVAKVSSTPGEIDQRVHFVPDPTHKRALLADLVSEDAVERVIVFTKTKHGANRVTKHLASAGIRAEAIHGNKSQNARERALEGFRDGDVRVLVATDIAARGLDIKGISHVVNYDLPVDAESYVHRIGRTARAGTSGVAISLCSHEEKPLLVRIEKLIGRRVPVAEVRVPTRRVAPESLAEERELDARDARGPHSHRERSNAPRVRPSQQQAPRVERREAPQARGERREAREPRDERRDSPGRARDERRDAPRRDERSNGREAPRRDERSNGREAPRRDERSNGREAARRDERSSSREAPRRDERSNVREAPRRDERREVVHAREERRDAPRPRDGQREVSRTRDEQRSQRERGDHREPSRARSDQRETPLVIEERREAPRAREDRFVPRDRDDRFVPRAREERPQTREREDRFVPRSRGR